MSVDQSQKKKAYKWFYFVEVDGSFYLHSESQRTFNDLSDCVKDARQLEVKGKLFFRQVEVESTENYEFKLHFFGRVPYTHEFICYSVQKVKSPDEEPIDIAYPDCYGCTKYFTID